VWRTKLPDAKFAVLPASNNRPNPLAVQDRLYISVFSPGAICALQRDGGKLIWRRELPPLAHSSVQLCDGRLFAKTAQELFALHPDSGETLWSFCPYGRDREFLYSSPSFHDGRVYIGDRNGILHCLDADSGKTIWTRVTSRARNNDVNSTPVIVDGLVIVSTNAGTAIAYDALSGKTAWSQKLDGPAVFGPVLHHDSVLAVADSLYILNCRTGKRQRRLSSKGERLLCVESTPGSVVMMFTAPDNVKLPADRQAAEKVMALHPPHNTLVFISNSGQRRTRKILAFCLAFRYAPASSQIYVSHLSGIDVLRPVTGTLVRQLRLHDDTHGGIAPVDVMDNKIYTLTGDGSVYALRNPS
jgi:outer membrane protein assembly factor BamB